MRTDVIASQAPAEKSNAGSGIVFAGATPAPKYKDVCQHCHSLLEKSQREKGFCCAGCELAWQFIHQMQLGDFYSLLKDKSVEKAQSDREDSLIELYDEPQFSSKFVAEGDEGGRTARLLIDGLTCYACVWLIRKALEKQAPDVDIEVSLSSGEADLYYPSDRKLSVLVALIQKLGYGVKPALEQREMQFSRELIRIGVNAFCFLNVMMLALPDYVDANLVHERNFWQLFRWVSLTLTSIVITYGSWPFYQTSWIYAKNRRVSVDQPIVVALILTFIFSTINTLRGQGDVYFDSICIIATLLLAGRYLQKRMVQKAERMIRGRFDHSMYYVKQWINGAKQIIAVSQLKKGDAFFVLPGDPIPVDATISSGKGEIHYEQITGESEPVEVSIGRSIKAGAVNLSNRLELRAEQDGSASFLTKINSMLARMLLERGYYTKLSDRLGSTFFVFIMLFAAMILTYHWSLSPEEAISRAVAALLIACPCGFAIAVPLAMTMCTAVAMRHGIIIKTQRAIETLGRVKRVYFDKTGTLTDGMPQIKDAYISQPSLPSLGILKDELHMVLSQLDNHSAHHAALALSHWARNQDNAVSSKIIISEFKEIFGQGLQFVAFVGDKSLGSWRVGQRQFCLAQDKLRSDEACISESEKEATVFVSVGGVLLARYSLEDQLLPDAKPTIETLRGLGLELGILSGDQSQRTDAIANLLALPTKNIFAGQSPLQKANKLSKSVNKRTLTAMVGNGFNDSLALANADVGIAVVNASQHAKDSAEVCLLSPGISKLIDAFSISKLALKKIKWSFLFASTYNMIGLTLAAFGKVNPAVAAALMPLSSLTVILIATRRWQFTRQVPVKL